MKRHLPALGALLFLHTLIFAKLIFNNSEGVPYATIPYDFASAYSRWLIYIGDCFQSHIFPLWSPYVGGGTPFFINPQSQLYSPLTLIIGTLYGYTQRVAQAQLVGMVFFGGVGAYLLSYALWRSRWSGLITAICFSFTSAVFSNFEHMTIINSFALMPWLFWATTITAEQKKDWGFPVLAFLIYFLLTGGYPGVILMTLLWLSAYTIYLFYFNPDPTRVKLRLGLRHGLAWLLGISLSSAHWIPIIIHRREFTRSAPLSVDQALTGGSLLFKHLWGIVFQFMTATPLPGNDTDISMRGLYFGALAIPLALAAILFIKDRIIPALLLLSCGAFLMACGSTFFGRLALHILFPPLNLSRFPAADSRALMVLGLALLAGGGARLLQEQHTQARAVTARACIYLIATLALGLFAFRSLVSAASYENFVLNYITAEILFVALAILFLRIFSGRLLMISLVTILALELGTCVVANFAIVGEPVSTDTYRALRASHRRDFTPESANAPRITTPDNPNISVTATKLVSEDSNRGYVEKTFHMSEYNPLRLKRLNQLIDAGFTDWMINGKRVVALPPESRPGDYESFQQQVRPVEYTILKYWPNEVGYSVRADQDSLLVFNEIFFPGWRATVDGQQQPVIEVCGGLRGLQVRGGEHLILMTFKPSSFYLGIGISLLSAALFLLWVLLIFYRARRSVKARNSRGQIDLRFEESAT